MKKAFFLAALIFLIVFTPLIIAAQLILQPAEALSDLVKATGDVKFENGVTYNDVTVLLANYFEYGYAEMSFNEYFKNYVPRETEDLKNYYLVPCLLVGIKMPDERLINKMTDAMIDPVEDDTNHLPGDTEIIDEMEVMDPYVYAERLLEMTEFQNIGINADTLGGYINMFSYYNDKFENSIEYGDGYESLVPPLDDEYLESIKDGWAYPFTSYKRVTAHVGLYNPFGEWENHAGTDFGASEGTSIYAVKSGTVIGVSSKNCKESGCFVRTLTDDGLTIEYWHMAIPPTFKIGDYINIGDFIGPVGATGRVTGPHLHLEIRVHETGQVVDYCKLNDCSNPNIGYVGT